MEEDIKILEKIKDIFIHLKNYGWINDIKRDIDTYKAIQSIENLIKGYKELEEENRKAYAKYYNCRKCIDKLNEQIKELEDKKIIKNEQIRNGQPVIANTRLTVLDVLYLMTEFINTHEEEFRKDIVNISINQIISAIDYFIDNSIPVSLVEEKIEELDKKEKELQNSISDEEREEYSDANISFELMDIEIRRSVLQELLEKRK